MTLGFAWSSWSKSTPCSGRAKSRCGGMLVVNFNNFYCQPFSGIHTFKVIILTLFTLMSFTSFYAYWFQELTDWFGRNSGRPAMARWLLKPNFHKHADKHKSKWCWPAIHTLVHPMVERPKPWTNGPTCSIYPDLQAQNRFPRLHVLIDQRVGATEGREEPRLGRPAGL